MKKDIEEFINPLLPLQILGVNELTYLERLILILIISLCKKNGYCWPTNKYFTNIFGCTKQTISKSISSLSKYGYIDVEINNQELNNSKRIIRLSQVLKNRITSIQENCNTGIQKNFNHNNKYINNKNNKLNNIYKRDEDGNEYWHDVKIESQKPTKEELEEMENLLKEFQELKEDE